MIALLLALHAGLPALPVPVPPTCSVTLTVDVLEAGDPFERQVYRYDAEAGEWLYLSYNGAPPPEEELEQFEERGRDGGDRSDDPVLPAAYYADSVSKLGPDWERLSPPDAEGLTPWGLEDLPRRTVVGNGRDLSGYIRLRYLLDEASDPPRLVVAGGSLKRTWRIPLIARIDSFDIERRFEPAGEETGVPGAMLPVTEHVDISANIIGRDRSAVIDTVFSDWACEEAEGS
jgi:hypothetical protein